MLKLDKMFLETSSFCIILYPSKDIFGNWDRELLENINFTPPIMGIGRGGISVRNLWLQFMDSSNSS